VGSPDEEIRRYFDSRWGGPGKNLKKSSGKDLMKKPPLKKEKINPLEGILHYSNGLK